MTSKKLTIKQVLIYLIGIIILSAGIGLNTKLQLGVSPIVSVPYNVSKIFNLSLGTSTFVYYCFLIFLQFLLLRKNFESFQLLQVIASFLTSYFTQFFDGFFVVPDNLLLKIFLLFVAITITGFGASLTIAMRVIPNPADGLANTIGFVLHKTLGFGKNLLDAACITAALAIGLLFDGSLLGIGLGTVIAMLATGRVLAVVHPFSEKLYQKTQS